MLQGETLRPQGCSSVSRYGFEHGGDLEFDSVQKTQVLSDAGMYLKPHPKWTHGTITNA